MKLTLRHHELPLRHEFTISRATSRTCRSVIVQLEHAGVFGYGEAPEDSYYQATVENISAALEQIGPQLESRKPEEPEALWACLWPQLRHNRFALCALDCAAWDLWGKLQGQPVWKLWGLSTERVPPTDYTIGIASPDMMVQKLQEMPNWPVYKIKLGTADDLAIVRLLRRHTASPFRVDANCAWTAEEAIGKAESLKSLGVEFIEQPLPPEKDDQMHHLLARSALPLVADESCCVESDVDRCAGRFHGVNVKLVKCGGLTPARRMLLRARQLGLKTMVGCMTESTVSISAAAQLLPLVDYADLDGALLLARDVATGVRFEQGRPIFPDEPGCGIRLLEA